MPEDFYDEEFRAYGACGLAFPRRAELSAADFPLIGQGRLDDIADRQFKRLCRGRMGRAGFMERSRMLYMADPNGYLVPNV